MSVGGMKDKKLKSCLLWIDKPNDKHLGYSGLFGELEHLKIKTRLIDEKFASVMGERREAEVELVTFGLLKLNSWSCKKTVSFPMSL